MRNKERSIQIAGLILLSLLVLTPAFIEPLSFYILLIARSLHFLLMAIALCMLGVVRSTREPLTYLVPAAVAALFFLFSAFNWDRVLDKPPNMLHPASLGTLLLMLSFVLAVWSAWQRKSWKKFEPTVAICIYAIVMLGCFYRTAHNEARNIAIYNKTPALFYFLSIHNYVYCVLLLPFLRKERWGGIALASVGGFALLIYAVLEYTPLGFAVRGNEIISPWSAILRFLMNTMESNTPTMLAAFFVGGL